jgi:hypothetical protein
MTRSVVEGAQAREGIRLRLVGGTLVVKSEPDRGTEILADVALTAIPKEDQVRMKTVGQGS